MAFYTYILQCADRSYYTGHTDDLERRIAQHQCGALRGYTYDRRPVELMWVEEFQTREEALSNEIRIKNWSRAKKEALITRDWDRLKLFSRPPGERCSLAGARHSPSTAACCAGCSAGTGMARSYQRPSGKSVRLRL